MAAVEWTDLVVGGVAHCHLLLGVGVVSLSLPSWERAGQEAPRSYAARLGCLPWGTLGTPAILVLASRRLRGPGWARSKRIPSRAAPPSPRPGGRRRPPTPPHWTVDAGGRRRPRPHTDRTALPSHPLLSGADGCTPASLTQRAGHTG